MGDFVVMIDLVVEWCQIYDEVWWWFCDFFYVFNMYGYDWVVLQECYELLFDFVGYCLDLNYLLVELIVEFNVLYVYVVGGDFEILD